MPRADAGLLTDQRSNFFEFFMIDVAVAVQIEHTKRDFEMPPGSCDSEIKQS